MKRSCHIGSILTFLFALALSPADLLWGQNQPIGMVVTVQGSVSIERGSQEMPAKPAQLLYGQDRLKVGSGSAILVFCPSSEKVTLTSGISALMTANGIEVSGGAPTRSPLGRCSLPQVTLAGQSIERVGAVRVRESGIPLIPLFLAGRIRSTTPLFSWQSIKGAERYQVQVRRAAEEQIWETLTDQNQAQFPVQKPLPDGYYEWQVEALQGDRIIATRSTRFEVRSDPGFDLPAEPLLAAVALQAGSYFTEAAALLRPLLVQSPQDSDLASQIAWLYLEAGLKETAELFE